MQVGKDWIEFSWKTPHSSITGVPDIFEVLVTYKISDTYHYTIMNSVDATSRYLDHPEMFIAWKAFELYTPQIKKPV